MFKLTALTEEDLAIFAQDIAITCQPGDCIALVGDLGAGKTSLARSFIRYLAGVDLDVPSPTFSLVQSYEQLELPVCHFDLYRIDDPAEVDELGLDEALETGVALIEWPERAGAALPASRLNITINIRQAASDLRDLEVAGEGDFFDRVAASRKVRQFLSAHDATRAVRRPLTGDASTRRYETIADGRDQRILMIAPRQADGPPVRDGKPYSKLVHLAEDIAPFVVIGAALRDYGFCSPRIDGFDLASGFMLLEDLGRGGIVDQLGNPIADRYRQSGLCLANLHGAQWSRELGGHGLSHTLALYDGDVFRMEAELLLDWYVPAVTGKEASAATRQGFTDVMAELWSMLDASRFTILLRDYHSPNIVYDGSKDGTDRIGIIDFQDALWGPAAYDVMSLVHDARATVQSDLGVMILDDYCQHRAAMDEDFVAEIFHREAAICTAQRLCKIMGIFHRLNLRDGKPEYLKHLPRVTGYFEQALLHPTLAPLAQWWELTGLRGNP